VLMEKERDGIVSLPWAHLRLPPFPQVAVRVLQLGRRVVRTRRKHLPIFEALESWLTGGVTHRLLRFSGRRFSRLSLELATSSCSYAELLRPHSS